MKYKIAAGTTSYIANFPIYDSSSTAGAMLAGITAGSTGMTIYYYRPNATSATVITATAMTIGTYATAGFVAVDATNMAGIYALGVPNGAIGTGTYSCTIVVKGATNMVPAVLSFDLGDDGGNQYLEGTYTRAQIERLNASVLNGVSSGMGGGSPVFSAAGTSGTKRVDGTVDASGNRTAVNLTPG